MKYRTNQFYFYFRQSTDLSPAILKQLSDNYNITVTPKRKDEGRTHRRASNRCKVRFISFIQYSNKTLRF